MSRIFFSKKTWGLVFLAVFFLVPGFVCLGDTISTGDSLSISAVVENNGGGTGGGGGFGGTPTTIRFSGLAYPFGRVTILENGSPAIITVADGQAKFFAYLANLKPGVYVFSIYATDSTGLKSAVYSFSILMKAGTMVTVGGIFLSPTIALDKSEVRRGDPVTVSGETAPYANVSIFFSPTSGQTIFGNTASLGNGRYSFKINTDSFAYGKYKVNGRSILGKSTSATSPSVPLSVKLSSRKKPSGDCETIRGDLNCDGHVNLIDFSIMAYWYHKTNYPNKVDLNKDGRITLVDFSILAFNWTG